MIDNFEGSSTKKQEKNGAGKESTKEGQCMYIFCSIACTDRHDWCHVARVTIDMLPDVALLEIFGVYTWLESWYMLMHVCRKWRNVVFGSPCRLNLRLYCTARTPVTETLNVWPLSLPIVVWGDGHEKWGVDNIVAALQHGDRMCETILSDLLGLRSEKVLAAMQQPFPALTRLGF